MDMSLIGVAASHLMEVCEKEVEQQFGDQASSVNVDSVMLVVELTSPIGGPDGEGLTMIRTYCNDKRVFFHKALLMEALSMYKTA